MKKYSLLLLILQYFTFNLYSQYDTVSTIPNPSFEEWSFDPRIQTMAPTSWEVSEDNHAVLSQSTDAVDGNYSIRLEGIDCCLNPRGQWNIENPEIFYYISCYVRAEGFHVYDGSGIWNPDPNVNISCSVYYTLENYDVISGSGYGFKKITQQGQWLQVSAALNMTQYINEPVRSARISIDISVCGHTLDDDPQIPGTLLVDNVQVSTTPFTTTLIEPTLGDTFISGEEDTIKWEQGSSGQLVKLEYSTDAGQSYQTLKDSLQYDKGMYLWDVPKDILTRKAKIILSDQSTDEVLVEGEYFIIKPYIITKVDYNGDLIAYDVNKDRWGFENIPEDDLWPQAYYNQIDYQTGEDPFTGNVYDQAVGGGVFASADSSDFPDWVSFVNAHGKNVCYNSDDKYIPRALHQWVSKKGVWKGSCFGIAISNALAFEKPYPFISQYPSFPPFADPITLMANDEVIPVITELFTHQYGKYEQEYLNNISIHKSPTETVEDIKNMLEEENVEVKTLSFYSNGLGGGHTINIYKLEQDTTDTNLYYVYVWDNSYADNLDAKIVVDVSHNGGIGFWDPLYGFNGWEGEKWFFIDDPANNYLNRAVLPKMHYNYSHFNLDENKLEICISPNAATIIEDKLGNRTGFSDDGYVLNEIPNSVPLIMRNGSTGPPYGYLLDIEDYSIQLNNFSSSESRSYFFTGNKTFLYQRNDAVDTQTDMLYFDDGISVSNPDSDTKIVKLVNIVSESDEKLFLIKSLSLAENDSIKIFNPDDNTLEIKSFGSEKNYQIELEFVSDVVSSRFSNDNVSITENTSHKLRPNWGDFAALGLEILVDEGNDGTIDDTLNIENQVVGVEEHGSNILPTEFNLEQNYPNPFNASTVIKYSIPEATLVNIKVFNILGEEVAELVNEAKQAGNYSVSFTADNLPSGIYFCRMTADQYKNVKKLVLIK